MSLGRISVKPVILSKIILSVFLKMNFTKRGETFFLLVYKARDIFLKSKPVTLWWVLYIGSNKVTGDFSHALTCRNLCTQDNLQEKVIWKMPSKEQKHFLYLPIGWPICKHNIAVGTELCFKATNGGPQCYSDNLMQTLIYLGTSWYFNTKSIYCLKKIIKATTWGPRHNILPLVVALTLPQHYTLPQIDFLICLEIHCHSNW